MISPEEIEKLKDSKESTIDELINKFNDYHKD